MVDHIKHKADIVINAFSQAGMLDAIHSFSTSTDYHDDSFEDLFISPTEHFHYNIVKFSYW